MAYTNKNITKDLISPGKTEHLLKGYFTVSEFAAKMQIDRQYVYQKIYSGEIKTVDVGFHHHVYIEWKANRNVKFNKRKKRQNENATA